MLPMSTKDANEAMTGGLANGSRVLLQQVKVKRGEEPFVMKLDTGVRMRAFFAPRSGNWL